MNSEMLKGLAERIAIFAGVYLVSKGYVPEGWQSNIVELISIALLAAISLIFGIKLNTQNSLIKAAAAMPDVKRVVVDEKVDASSLSTPGAKVTKS